MHVCLVSPPMSLRQTESLPSFAPVLPLGLAYLAASLRSNGHSVNVIDCQMAGRTNQVLEGDLLTIGLPWIQIKERIEASHPDIVGVGCTFSSRFLNALKIAGLVKEIDSTVPVVMGGIHPTIKPFEVLNQSEIDFVVLGEGEKALLDLVDGKPHNQIDGFGYKQDGTIHVNPKTKFIENLDSLPFPARDLFLEYFRNQAQSVLRGRFDIHNSHRNSVITSRGCPNSCAFCSIHSQWGFKWRARTPENVVEELKEMKEKYHVREISFDDDNLTLDRKRMIRLCKLMISEKIDLEWDTPNGVSVITLNRELLLLMKKAGCWSLNLAIESGDPHILRNIIHKPLTLGKAAQVVKDCKALSIKTQGYFVIGMPGETIETMNHSLDFARSLPLDAIGVFNAVPFPNTELYENAVRDGYLAEVDFSKVYADNDLQRSALLSTPWLSSEEVLAFQKRFYDKFDKSNFYRLLKFLRRKTQNQLGRIRKLGTSGGARMDGNIPMLEIKFQIPKKIPVSNTERIDGTKKEK